MAHELSNARDTDARTTAVVSRDSSRVLLVAPQPFYEDRGTPIAVRYVLEALSELGYQVDVLTFPLGRSLDIPGVRFFRVPNPLGFRSIPVGFSLKKLFLDVFLMRLLRERLRRTRYLCVHAVEEGAFLAAVLCRSRGVFVTYDMQSAMPEQLAQRFVFRIRPVQAICQRLERWLLSNVNYVVCSAGLAKHVRSVAPRVPLQEWHFPSNPPSVSPDVIRALRRELRIPDDSQIVLYTGTFEDYQGLPMLIDAIHRVGREIPQAVFVLVGAMYAGAEFQTLVWDRPLSRPQIELVASRVSAVSECFY